VTYYSNPDFSSIYYSFFTLLPARLLASVPFISSAYILFCISCFYIPVLSPGSNCIFPPRFPAVHSSRTLCVRFRAEFSPWNSECIPNRKGDIVLDYANTAEVFPILFAVFPAFFYA
jgi:hypothetical protein